MEKYNFKRYGDELRFNYCPICKKTSNSNPHFTIDVLKGVYYCHVAGEGGSIRNLKKDYDFDFNWSNVPTQEERQTPQKNFKDIFLKYSNNYITDNDEWIKYLSSRGISNKYLNIFCRLGKNNTMAIPITNKNEIIGIKYRSMDKHLSCEAGTQSNYFLNWQNITDTSYLIIVEGEIDLLSVIEANFDNVVSLPMGANNTKCIDTQKEWIEQFSKIIIATDNDEAGEKSRKDIIKKLGNIENRLYKIDYGKYKDFNEVLVAEGTAKIKDIIEKAQKIPIDTTIFFGDKGKFYFSVFANYLKEKYNIIKIDNELHCYDEGIYKKGFNIEKIMIQEIEDLNTTKRRETLEYLKLICEDKEKDITGLIAFKNGVYSIFDDKLYLFSTDCIITNYIPWDYNPNTYNELMDKTLNKFAYNDETIRTLIEEVIGYILFPKNELGKSFIIIGDKANGKSTFLKIIMFLIGEDNTSALSLDDIINSRFRLYEVSGKLVNIGDDIGNGYIPESENFRKLVTGDVMVAEKKGKDPIKFSCYAKFIFSANEIPRIKDPTGATARRVIIIPFKNSFTQNSKDYDPYFLDKIKNSKCMEYLINVGIEGLKRVLKNKGFSETEETKKLIKEFNENNNSVIEYVDYLENEGDNPMELKYIIEHFSCMKIYNGDYGFPNAQDKLMGFKDWLISNGLKSVSFKTFKDSMKQNFKFSIERKLKNGKKERYFCFIDQ